MKKDIIKAVNIEQQYFKERFNGMKSFNLKEAICACGFNSLKEFHEMKKDYKVKQIPFNCIEFSSLDYLENIFNIFEKKKPVMAFVDTEATFVFTGRADFNKKYCLDNKILILPHFGTGGTIISSKGDLSFGICCYNDVDIDSRYLLKGIKKILQKYTNKIVTINKNDILIDGKKVLGSTIYQKNEFFFFVAHFSFNDNSELIKNICPSQKIKKEPGWIDFMSRKILKEEIKKWLKKPFV